MKLDKALETFVAEAGELLAELENSLLLLENEPDNIEHVHSMFRAAHTLKGSAGLFALDPIVSITHVMESLLDSVREGEREVTPELIAVLLPCRDHIASLVGLLPEIDLDDTLREEGAALRQRLEALQGNTATPQIGIKSGLPVPGQVELDSIRAANVATDNWHLSLRFGKDVLRNGMDPLSFIRYLGTLGKIASITTMLDDMPAAEQMDAESCYLGFEIDLQSDASKETLENVFEFVRDDAQIRILPPRSMIGTYIDLIHSMPEQSKRLGEILLASGALTAHELETCLAQQAEKSGASLQPIGEIMVENHVVQPEVVTSALEKQKQVRESRNVDSKLVRVQADKLDNLINLVGELVIAGAGANLLAQRQGNGNMLEATVQITRLVEEIRDSALRLRMVQIGETFSRFQRVVRDVSRELGKDIELVISGADTELDKSVVEKIGDPLTHLVRNSMDHGIEPAEVRKARGKPAAGTLKLNAYHDSGSIVIEVSDDGGGLNSEKILNKAIERGIVSPGQSLTEREIFNLIFEPGFSTADKVSNLSGRGVGMDVVRRNIEALRGTVELDSKLGEGTTVRIRLPLTLAIIDGFLVGVGNAGYVVPLESVLECVELPEEERLAAQRSAYVNLRGEVLPYVRLRDHFEISGHPERRENVVVVQYAGRKAGLVVDKLMGEYQTVIKPLGKVFAGIRGISGSTILGTGEVALILDVANLVQQASAQEAGRYMAQKVFV